MLHRSSTATVAATRKLLLNHPNRKLPLRLSHSFYQPQSVGPICCARFFSRQLFPLKNQSTVGDTTESKSFSEQIAKHQQRDDKRENKGPNGGGKRGSPMKRIFGVALLAALCVPFVLGGLGKIVCDQLNAKEEQEFEDQVNRLNLKELGDFVVDLVTQSRYSSVLEEYIGDTSVIRKASDKVMVQPSKTLYLFGTLQSDDQEPKSVTHHMKGVCHIYYPILTAKGGALLKLTLITGNKREDGSLPLHKYSVYLIPTNRKMNLNAITEFHKHGLEENNRNHITLTGDQIYELYEDQTKDSLMNRSISLVCVGLSNDILLFEGGVPDGIKQRESNMLEYTKHMEPRMVSTSQ